MAAEWRIDQDGLRGSGWSVYRNGRAFRYDCVDLDDALSVVKRKVGRGVKVEVIDISGHRSTTKT